MRLTEHEMTTALHGYAKTQIADALVTAQQATAETATEQAEQAWTQMERYARFKILDSIGKFAFPIFANLPDIDVPTGTKPTFTDDQITAAITDPVRTLVRNDLNAKTEGQISDADFDAFWAENGTAIVATQMPAAAALIACLPARTEDAQPADRATTHNAHNSDHSSNSNSSDSDDDLSGFVVPDDLSGL